jgi:Skp family chaperone for outer membrane proteins
MSSTKKSKGVSDASNIAEVSRKRLIGELIGKTTPLTPPEKARLIRLRQLQPDMSELVTRRLRQEEYIRYRHNVEMKKKHSKLQNERERNKTKQAREKRINENRRKEEEFNSQVEMFRQLEVERERKRKSEIDKEIDAFFDEMDKKQHQEQDQFASSFLI